MTFPPFMVLNGGKVFLIGLLIVIIESINGRIEKRKK